MPNTMFTSLILLLSLFTHPASILGASSVELSSKTISLETRYQVPSVNQVFKDNILLTLNYMSGTVRGKNDINWENVKKPAQYEFTLNPGERFAFHDTLLSQYKDGVVKTTNAHFNSSDGFLSDRWLYGDGVCHLASLIHWLHWTRTESFPCQPRLYRIPEISREYGVSIKYMPGETANSARQNLYITNNQDVPVTFVLNMTEQILRSRLLRIYKPKA